MQRRWIVLFALVAVVTAVPAIGIGIDLLLHSADPETNIGVTLALIALGAVGALLVSKIESC